MKKFLYAAFLCSLTAAAFAAALAPITLSPGDSVTISSPPAPPPPPEVTRDWRYWPFTNTSPWNMPIGSGAVYVPAPGVSGLPVSLGYPGVGSSSPPVSIAKGNGTDVSSTARFRSLWDYLAGGGVGCGASNTLKTGSATTNPALWNYYSTIHSPSNVLEAPATYHATNADYFMPILRRPNSEICPNTGDTDNNMSYVQLNGWVFDTVQSVITVDGTVMGSFGSFANLKGAGTGWDGGRRASMFTTMAGVIRRGELENGKPIPHALVALVPATILKEQAQWPAWAFDMNSGYSGTLPMGALLAIPASTDVTTLGLSANGLIIAHTLQDYGLYLGDRGGGGIGVVTEKGHPATNQYGSDLNILFPLLRWVSNNSATSVGGGGTPRVALAPAFYDGGQ